MLASGEAVEQYGLKPMAKLVGWGQGGVDPKIMGVGPVPASRQAMNKAGLKIDIDLVEANEAFAAQSVAVARELQFDMNKVNVNGGAIALGHPVGASGARIIVTLLHEMQKRPEAKKGLATLCIGGGEASEDPASSRSRSTLKTPWAIWTTGGGTFENGAVDMRIGGRPQRCLLHRHLAPHSHRLHSR